MAEIINWADLFDFSNDADVKKAITLMNSLNKKYKELIATADSGSRKLTANHKALIDSLKSLQAATSGLNVEKKEDQKLILEQNAQLKVLNSTLQKHVKEIAELKAQSAALTKERKAVRKSVQDLNNINKESIKLEAQLGKLTGKSAKEHAELRLKIQETRKARAEEAKIAAGRVTLYQTEVKRLNELTNKYLSVALAQGKSSKAARVLEKELTVLRSKIQGVEQAAGRGHRTIGLYGKSMMRTASQIASAFGIVGGVFLIADLVKSTFSLIKETERYNKALKQVTDTNDEYLDQMDFLLDISNRYGIDLNKLTDSYTKFFAATKGTNLEGKETQRIFDAVSKSAAVMSLTTEDTEGALKALGQMISKGKVQAEELRGQLGDRLPGAFRIMADALNVTTSELDKMLKDGKLLADEVLPKFATQLEIAFGLDKVDSVETLTAAQTRLTNSWITFVKNIEDGEGALAKFTISAINGITSVLNLMSQTDEDIASRFISEYGVRTIEEFNALIEKSNLNLSESDQKAADLARQYVINREGLTIYNAAIRDGFKTKEEFIAAQDEFINQYGEEKDNLDILKAVYLEYTSRLDAVAKAKAEAAAKAKAEADALAKAEADALAAAMRRAQQRQNAFKNVGSGLKEVESVFYDSGNKMKMFQVDLTENEKEQSRLRLQIAQDEANKKTAIAQNSAQAISMIGNQLFINSQINRDNDLKKFVDAKNVELESVGENAQARAAITDQIAKKEKEARIEEAKARRKQAIFNIAINAIEKIATIKFQAAANAAIPFIGPALAAAALAQIPLVLGFAALETGLVLSQPLPAFEDGGLVKTDGDIQVTEKGREMYIGKDGKLGLLNGDSAQVVSGMKGSTILPNPVTESLLRDGFDHEKMNVEATLQITQVLQQQQDRNTRLLAKTIQDENTFLAESFKRSIDSLPEIHQWHIKNGQLEDKMRKGNTTFENWKRKNSYS